MTKFYQILTVVFLAFLVGLLGWGGYLVLKNKGEVKDLFNKNVPTLTTLGTVNLPGKLLGPQAPNHAANLDATKIIEWTNYYRAQEGLPALAQNSYLARAAQTKVQDMFQKQYFEHVAPDGTTPGQVVLSSGYNYRVTGENLALGDFKDEKELVDAWMGSPGHRANILNQDYTEIGVASGLNEFEDRGTTWLSVQEFGHPAPNCTKPDQALDQEILFKKENYDNLVKTYEGLVGEAEQLASSDRKLAKLKYDEAENLRLQINIAYAEIDVLIQEYNAQVDTYNQCIKE